MSRIDIPIQFTQRGRRIALAAVPLTLLLAACGGSQPSAPAQPVTVTVTSYVTLTAAPSGGVFRLHHRKN